MKRGLLYGVFTAFGVAALAFVAVNDTEGEYYQPRMEQQETEQGIAGSLEWWKMMRGNVTTGEVSLAEELAARQQLADMQRLAKKSSNTISWSPVGPDNFGGRTRAFLIDRSDANTFYAGSVGGGLFKSTDAGASWAEVTSTAQPNVAITCLAQASDGTIYFGTGEGMYGGYNGSGNTSTPKAKGGGIYKLSNGVIQLLPSTVPNSVSSDFGQVGKIEVDPNNPNRIYAATNRGLMKSDDAGLTWNNPMLNLAAFQAAPDMTITPSGTIWVKVGSGIYKSTSGNDNSFSQITGNGIPPNTNRMRIAVSPQDENYVYVASINSNQALDKVYRSTDGGITWTVIGNGGPGLNIHANQGYWNNALTVDPTNKDRIIAGGLDLYEWSEQNGWKQLSQWFLNDVNASSPYYVHADNHNIVFSKKNPKTFYILNDGGVFKTTDNGVTFSQINKNYQTTQFYHIGLGPDNMVMGGTQDNGTFLIDPNGFFPKSGTEVRGGDGGYAQMSRLAPGIVFAESQNGAIGRSLDYGDGFDNFLDLPRMDWGYNSNIPGQTVIGTPQWSNWIMPYKLWEKFDDPHSTDSLRLGADRVVTNLGVGGGRNIFNGNFLRPYSYTYSLPGGGQKTDEAQFIADSLVITAGNQVVTWDANSGELVGDGEGSFDPATGSFTVVFDKAVNADQVIARIDVRYDAGTVLRFFSKNGDIPVYDTLSSSLEPGEEFIIQDPRQAFMVLGLRTLDRQFGNNDGGIWMSREVLSEKSGVPEWWHIASLTNNEAPTTIDVSGDGDVVFVGTNAGNVYRISNLNNARDSVSADIDDLYTGTTFVRGNTSIVETDVIYTASGNRTITGVAVNPFDKNKVVITMGNYGQNNFIAYSSNASSTNPFFSFVDGNYPDFPAYCAIFNTTNSSGNEVLIGTEFGVFRTEDISQGSNTQWNQENNGMANVMVLSLQQDLSVRQDMGKEFEGGIWAGTHGRGIYKTDFAADYVSIEENELEQPSSRKAALKLYPNPAVDRVMVELNLSKRSNVSISIRNISGKLLKTVEFEKLDPAVREVELNVSGLARGSYIISMHAEGELTTGKLIKQ